MAVNVEAIDTRDRRRVRQWLELPFRVYRDAPQWVPPLASDAKRQLDRQRHPFFQHSNATFLLAFRGERVVGRLAVLNNQHYNAHNREKTAHWFLFESDDDTEISRALFGAGLAWARAQGLDKANGPKGLTALDGLGLLVKGFEHRPALGIPYNHDYYPRLIEDAGFVSDGDIVSGYLNTRKLDAQKFDKFDQVAELVKKRRNMSVMEFKSRGDLRRAVPQLLQLYNESVTGMPGNVPFTPDEAKTMADQIIWFADPKLIKILLKDDKPVGFLLAYPDVSAALQQTRGELFPFGWLRLLRELRRTKWANLNGAGILERHRGVGGDAILFSEMRRSIVAGGFDHVDLVQVGAENDRMQREMRDLGIDFYKAHRMYSRALSDDARE